MSRFKGHSSRVTALAFLPDGEHVVSADSSKTLRVWRTTTGEAVRTFDAAAGDESVRAIELSADGGRLVALTWHALYALELATGKHLSEVKIKSSATSFGITPDARRALIGVGRERTAELEAASLFDLTTGMPVAVAVPPAVRPGRSTVALSADGKQAAAVTGDRTVITWPLADLDAARILEGHGQAVTALAFTPDGRRLVTAGADQQLRLWDVQAGTLVRWFPAGAVVTRLAWAPDGRRLLGATNAAYAVGGLPDYALQVWDMETGAKLFRHNLPGSALATGFSADGRFLAAGGWDGQVVVWQSPRVPSPGGLVASSGGPVATGGTGAPEDPIERPDFRNQIKPVQRRQQALKGLVVLSPRGGESAAAAQYGFATDIILTVAPRQGVPNDPRPRRPVELAREVGDSMQVSLREAERAVRVRYPYWEPEVFSLSFQDKYAPLDGGSAGTAFAVLLLSAMEGVDLDRSIAVTGDITVDWKVRRIGGVAAKIRGATLDGCKCVMIPRENETQASDLLISRGGAPFWDV